MRSQGGGCAFAVCAGDTDNLCRAQLEEDAYLGRNEPAGSTGDLEKLVIGGDCGIGDNNIGLLKIRRGVRAEMKFDAGKVPELVN